MNSKTFNFHFGVEDSEQPTISMKDFLQFFENCGNLYIGIGEAEGENRAEQATYDAIDTFKDRSIISEKVDELLSSVNSHCPREEITLKESGRVLVQIEIKNKTQHKELSEIMSRIDDSTGKDTKVYYGCIGNPSLGDKLKVTIIATDRR